MNENINKILRKYVQVKFPEFNVADTDKVEILRETRSDGYCETCSYDYEVWVIYINSKPVKEFDDDLASILNEILSVAE